MRIVRVTDENRARYEPGIVALEGLASYPLGSDRFRIDHGSDYFRFFRRLGELQFYVAEEDEEVVAVGAGILRSGVPDGAGRPTRAWYLCDLKVHPDFRGRRIPLAMLQSAFLRNYLRCPRGYAVSMNPGDGSANRVVRLVQRFRLAPVHVATTLHLFSLDAEAMRRVQPRLERHRGRVSFLSLTEVKAIVLESTGAPMPLLHAQFGPLAQHGVVQRPLDGHVHMFCAPENDPLVGELAGEGIAPTASATVVQHGLDGADWRWILTSDV